MSGMTLQDKLSKNHVIPPAQPAIMLISSPVHQQLSQLLNACPAGLYRLNEAGEIIFDANGCLECGTCRMLCGDEVIAQWHYPPAGTGITFRFG